MRNLFWFGIVLLAFTVLSCEKESVDNAQEEVLATKVVGEWQLYRNEDLEETLDEFIGTAWTTVDKWFKIIRKDSQIIIEFKADGTFENRYADVVTSNGIWGVLEDGRYYFDHAEGENNIRDGLDKRRYITFYCDNTYSVEIADNERSISYYKVIGSVECAAEITYKVLETED